MNYKKCIAFLDILGFKSHIDQEQNAAINMLASINFIFQTRLSDHNVQPWQDCEPILQPLVKRVDIDSFESFLPMSDSIFIIGHDANTFLDQISSFMCSCFRYTADAYKNPMIASEPEKVTMNEFGLDAKGESIIKEIETRWYPNIFRGGVSFGEATILQMTSLMRNETFMTKRERSIAKDYHLPMGVKPMANIAGKGVIQAVSLEQGNPKEQRGKGPKLYLDEHIINELDGEHKLLILNDINGKQHFMWPAYSLIWENDFKLELTNNCRDFLLPAINLWVGYKDTRDEAHYLEFVKLIINSYITIAKRSKNEEITKEFLKKFLQNLNVDYTPFNL